MASIRFSIFPNRYWSMPLATVMVGVYALYCI